MYYDELNTKDKVMLTIGTEYEKDIPDFGKALKNMSIDTKIIDAALIKLNNEGYIDGIITMITDNSTAFNPDNIDFSHMIPTLKGIEYVKELKKELGWNK